MKIEISVENDKWLRVDLVNETGLRERNLFHASISPFRPLLLQYADAEEYVEQNYSKFAKLKFAPPPKQNTLPHPIIGLE